MWCKIKMGVILNDLNFLLHDLYAYHLLSVEVAYPR